MVPNPLVVAANGLLKETIDGGDSTTYVWEADDPMASYLATVSIDDFAIQMDDSIAGLPIINYFPTERAEALEEWGDMWLKEGFATYAEWLWLEHTKGKETAAEFIARKHKIMSSASGSDSYVQPGRPSIDRLYMPNIYDGGATVLHALRLHVGDEAFFNILQTYSDRFHDGNAGTADFIAVAEEVSEQDLTDFFDVWLYSNDVPELEAN